MDSALGVRPDQSIALFRGELTSRFEPAPGPCWLCGAVFTIDTDTCRCIDVQQVILKE
jgi:calcineurin-like phosphoesterase